MGGAFPAKNLVRLQHRTGQVCTKLPSQAHMCGPQLGGPYVLSLRTAGKGPSSPRPLRVFLPEGPNTLMCFPIYLTPSCKHDTLIDKGNQHVTKVED